MSRSPRIIAMLVSLLALSAGLTGLFLGFCSIVTAGGLCPADGGAVPVATCPVGAPSLLLASVIAGLIGFAGYRVMSPRLPGPHLIPLVWPAAFLPQAWTVLSNASDQPEYGGWGGIGFGLLLLALGAFPLIDLLRRNTLHAVFYADAAPVSRRVPGYPRGYTLATALKSIDDMGRDDGTSETEMAEMRARVMASPLGQQGGPPAVDPKANDGKRALTLAQAVTVVAGMAVGFAAASALMY
ncbi:MAG: hypothetical protein NTZ03_06590 [Actinobacteria bacterium]|nr:hypothetical protein [Actinomycetota bacterium]